MSSHTIARVWCTGQPSILFTFSPCVCYSVLFMQRDAKRHKVRQLILSFVAHPYHIESWDSRVSTQSSRHPSAIAIVVQQQYITPSTMDRAIAYCFDSRQG